MAKSTKNSVKGLNGINVVVKGEAKAKYVSPITPETFIGLGDLSIEFGGNTYVMKQNPIVAGKSLGWSSPEKGCVDLGGAKGNISPYGLFIVGSSKMEIDMTTLPETVTATVGGTELVWHLGKSESGTIGWKLKEDNQLKFNWGAEVQATANIYGLYLNKTIDLTKQLVA